MVVQVLHFILDVMACMLLQTARFSAYFNKPTSHGGIIMGLFHFEL